ncbi:unnamed protein product [Calypogeia fissa]
MEMDDIEDYGDDNDSLTTIFSTSSQASAKTIMSLQIEDLRKAFGIDDLESSIPKSPIDASTTENTLWGLSQVGLRKSISWKEYCRRVRKYWSKEEYATFKNWIRELKALREARERRKMVPKMHPIMFGCWPRIPIHVGDWESTEFFGRIDKPPTKEASDPIIKIIVPETLKHPLPIGTNCCARYCKFGAAPPPPTTVEGVPDD